MSFWMLPTLVIATLLTIPPLGAFLRLWGPLGGFFPFFIGIFLALISGIALAAAAAFAAATAKPWRASAVKGAILPLLVVASVFLLRPDSPGINDISTDLENRPGFVPDVAAALGTTPLDAETLAYFAEVQRESYPEVRPILLNEPPDASFERALAVARAMPSWKVTFEDPARGQIEAIAESSIFRFVDDVSIRIRPEGSGSRIDTRSRSRVGQGDLGANAHRILAFNEALQR
jgi:uncharacterized protein (DUF1499 family)